MFQGDWTLLLPHVHHHINGTHGASCQAVLATHLQMLRETLDNMHERLAKAHSLA